jgi:hypothetical protein
MSPFGGPPAVVPSYESFQSNHGGFLKLWLKERWRHDHLELFIDDGIEYSIINGCWLHPHAAGILQGGNHISCIMLDTTWSVLREYATAILVGISRNTVIPLEVAFGPVEDFELYEMFWSIFSA